MHIGFYYDFEKSLIQIPSPLFEFNERRTGTRSRDGKVPLILGFLEWKYDVGKIKISLIF